MQTAALPVERTKGKYECNQKITKEMTLPELKDLINQALETDSFDNKMAQETIDWLKEKELNILKETHIPIKKREIVFDKFNRAVNVYGVCTVSNKKENELYAKIRMTKYLKVKNNADAILSTLAHEVLHGLLPYEETHGFYFRTAMIRINDKTGLNISISSNKKTSATPKYQVYCPSCGNIVGEYYRKSALINFANQIHCSKCRHNLKVKTLR